MFPFNNPSKVIPVMESKSLIYFQKVISDLQDWETKLKSNQDSNIYAKHFALSFYLSFLRDEQIHLAPGIDTKYLVNDGDRDFEDEDEVEALFTDAILGVNSIIRAFEEILDFGCLDADEIPPRNMQLES